MNTKRVLVFCCIFSVSSLMAQPLQNELMELTRRLDNLANALRGKKTPVILLESSQLENLPNEVILNIIQQSIPDQFETGEEMYTTIRSLLGLVASSKRLNEVYIDTKKLLSNAIQKSKDTFRKPKYVTLESLNPEDREQYKIINGALLKAFDDNNLSALKLLLENGANINTEYKDLQISLHPFTLLMWALADEKKEKKAQLLLSLVTPDNAQQVLNYWTGYSTPFGYAIQGKNLPGIELLFKAAKKYGVPVLVSRGELLSKETPHEFLDQINQLAGKYGVGIR